MTPDQAGALILVAAVYLACYARSCKKHPYTRCGWCGGRGKFRAWIFRWAWGDCHRCSGKGRKQRWGARLLGYGHPRQRDPKFKKRTR